MDVVLGFSKLTVLEQIQRCRVIEDSITGNASFPTPVPTMAAFGAATDDTETAYNDAVNGDSVKRQLWILKRAEMLDLARQLGSYVDNVAAGDTAVILSSGFSIRQPQSPVAPPAQVTNMRLTHGLVTGTIHGMWNGAARRRVYHVQLTTNVADESTWTVVGETTGRFFDISGLVKGTTYWVRVQAIGTRGLLGPVSDPAVIMCL